MLLLCSATATIPTMPVSIILILCIVTVIPSLHAYEHVPPTSIRITSAITQEETFNGIKWTPDNIYINTGTVTKINTPGIMPFLSCVRHFPNTAARKYCYNIKVNPRSRYLIRTTYYYGAFDGGKEPPVFDQIIDGMKWSTVNTSDNYAKGLTSFFEIIVQPQRRFLSVCLARNSKTTSNPFISALELINLEASMYNTTDFQKYALSTVARHGFGQTQMVSYPDDSFNRYWMPFNDDDKRMIVDSQSNITSSDFWNIPPASALSKGFTESAKGTLVVNWPPMSLPAASYYVVLYFQDNRTPSPYSWRVMDVFVNNKSFYIGLNVTTAGTMVYGKQWPLSGQTELRLKAGTNATKGPILNAGEILQVVPLGPATFRKDKNAMDRLARGFDNPPSDWRGDPCLPKDHSWTGVTCTGNRVTSLDLTNQSVSGYLSQSLAYLTAMKSIKLSSNKLSGPIPGLKHLTDLVSLHLDNNNLNGLIPPTLAELPKLKELYLQNNKFEGQVPEGLKNKPGVDIRV